MDLIQMLTSQLGVDEKQARGGAGLLFGLAKDRLSGGEFEQIRSAVPRMGQYLESAPSGGLASAIGGLATSLTGRDKLGSLATVVGGFKELGLDREMVARFLPIILGFVQAQGGEQLKGLLSKALR